MIEVISVKFKGRGKSYYFAPGDKQIKSGQQVIVETSKGLEIADCTHANHFVNDDAVVQPLRPVVRIATADDLRIAEINKKREKEAFEICQKKIAEHGLDMKLIDVECNFDGSKTMFFFTSDGRVDFRELVKDLAGIFRNRIELRQIGVRDEAKMLGGLGICGRPFCCSRFLDEFQPVSTKMAKVQSMSLNPSKISGSCGRLMCCLRYEQEAYEELVKSVPKQGAFVETPDGYGNVTQVNLLRQLVKVKLDGGGDGELKTFRAVEVATVPGGRPKDGETPPSVLKYVPEPEPEVEPEDEWALPQLFSEDFRPEEPESAPAEKPQQRNRRSRNRHRKPKSGEKKPVEAKEPAKQQPSEEKQPVKPRPKSSRGGRKPKAADGVSVKAEAVPVEKKETKQPQAKDAAQKKNNRRHYYRRGKPRNKQGGQPPKQ